MPQMMPMSWIMIYIYFLMMMMMFITKMYFYKNMKKNSMTTHMKTQQEKIWKW
uniref:ATP synthase F0 subunit 8 n=1 Tax=Sosibia gibba TaxID=3026508 RepID=UPI0023D89A1F|nr:ATP synthase F0 subunit 8 [Sosibia gibba]WCS40808.1 ATP synthase F0 subunit 8 [Sosibia gibba]